MIVLQAWSRLSGMLDRLCPVRLIILLFLVANAVSPLAVSGDGRLSDLLPVTGRFPGSALIVVKLVDLLESHILCLVDEEPNEENRNPGETTPNPEDIGLCGIQSRGEVWSDERQKPVKEPVRRCRETKTFGASLQWE